MTAATTALACILLSGAAACLTAGSPAAAAPVTQVEPAGSGYWIGHFTVGAGRHLSFYANRPMRRDRSIDTVIVVIHGAGRDAANAANDAATAAFAAGHAHGTAVIAPAFRASSAGGMCHDVLEDGEVDWGCWGWRYGDPAGNAATDSFAAMDEMLQWLGTRATYPNLRKIIVLGHSAGGQFVARYALVNTVQDKLTVAVDYVAANASSYAYLDTQRPRTPNDVLDPATAGTFRLKGVADAQGCTGFDEWPYGLSGRIGYSGRVTEARIRSNAASRKLTILAGELDDHPNTLMDETCRAYYQGANRLERARNYVAYLEAAFHGTPVLVTVPGCGHNATCMYVTDAARKEIFGAP